MLAKDFSGGVNLDAASADDVRITSARIVERGDAANPSIIRVEVALGPTSRQFDHRVHLRDFLASRPMGLLLHAFVDVVEAGCGGDTKGRRWRGVPRARDATSFVFGTALPDFTTMDVIGDPPTEGATGFVFIVSAVVVPLNSNPKKEK